MNSLTQQIGALGHVMPAARLPAANYVSTTLADGLLVISGQIGTPGAAACGPAGAGLSVEAARLEAHTAALGLLATLDAAIHGDMSRIEQVLRLGVFIAAAPGFDAHSQVANGASDLLVAALGERGRHARTAVGVTSLPAGAAVEVDALVRLRPAQKA